MKTVEVMSRTKWTVRVLLPEFCEKAYDSDVLKAMKID